MIAGIAILVRIIVSLTTRFTSEDFLITLRYADNLAAGHGFVYNMGERVLGTTTPLYTLFLAAITKTGMPAVVVGKAVNILTDGALCIAAYLWLESMGQQSAGRMAAVFLAINPISVRWSISGMETSLVSLFCLLALLAFTRKREASMYSALGILFWLRWDSLLLSGVLTLAVLVRERAIPLRGLAIYGIVIAPWLLYSWLYFGSPIPITASAKMAVYGWRARNLFFPQLPRLTFRLWGTWIYAGVFLCTMIGLYRAWSKRLWPVFPAVTWLLVYFAAFLYSKNLLFEWYLAPPLPVYAALFGLGVTTLTPLCDWIPRGPRWILGWGCVAAATIGINYVLFKFTREAQLIEENLRKPMGIWLRDHSAPTDRIMLEPIGYIGYYADRRILDTVGLVSPEVIPYWKESSIFPMFDVAQAFKPEWVVLRPGELDHIHDAARAAGIRWEDLYALERTFSYTPRPNREWITFHAFRRRG